MSTLVVSNVSDGTLSIPTTYVTNGSAKAWVLINGVGTISIRNSFNVSSLTDIQKGVYEANLTNSFSSTDVAYTTSTVNDFTVGEADQPASTANFMRVIVRQTDGPDVEDDPYTTIVGHGDLA